MITASKFASNLKAFSKLDDVARSLFAETCAYVLYQHHAHGNKDPWLKLKDAPLPGWIKDAFGKLTLGKRDKGLTDRLADLRGAAYAASVFASQEEKRAIAKANRTARAERAKVVTPEPEATPEPIEAESHVVEVTNALVINGEMLDISANEAAAILVYLDQLRRPALKAA